MWGGEFHGICIMIHICLCSVLPCVAAVCVCVVSTTPRPCLSDSLWSSVLFYLLCTLFSVLCTPYSVLRYTPHSGVLCTLLGVCHPLTTLTPSLVCPALLPQLCKAVQSSGIAQLAPPRSPHRSRAALVRSTPLSSRRAACGRGFRPTGRGAPGAGVRAVPQSRLRLTV